MSAYRTAATFVVTTLRADAAVAAVVGNRIYEGLAPKSASYPLVTVQPYTDPEHTNFYGRRALTVVDLIVRVWDSAPDSKPSSAAGIAPVADRIDALLSFIVPRTTATGVVGSSANYSEVASTEFRDGSTVRALGGRFRVVISPLPA